MKSIAVIVMVFIALFTGCSEEGRVGESDTRMELNIPYGMSTGGVITKTSSDANISVVADVGTDATTATLLSGSATCTECTKL